MRNLTLTFFLTIVLHLVVGVAVANALPQCTGPSYRHNCEDTVTYSDGTKYVGAFKDGKSYGQGTLTFANGEKYVGAFKYDKIHGRGTYTFADGGKYVGAFKDNKRHGQGTYTFPNGNKYVGAFKDNKLNGQGTFTYANGDKYVGAFKNDKKHGQGKYHLADGRIVEGIWEANKFLYAQKAPARGKNTKEEIAEAMRFAKANLVPEIIECAVFYQIIGQGDNPTATKLQKASAFLLELGYLLAKSINMKDETVGTMVDQYSAEMIQAVDKDLINIRILTNKHGKFCKKLATNQTDRLTYWFQKEINR